MRGLMTVMTAAAVLGFAGAAAAQTSDETGNFSNGQTATTCRVSPCRQGTPPAAPGGEAGSGPASIRGTKLNSPVGTGVGGGSGSGGSAR